MIVRSAEGRPSRKGVAVGVQKCGGATLAVLLETVQDELCIGFNEGLVLLDAPVVRHENEPVYVVLDRIIGLASSEHCECRMLETIRLDEVVAKGVPVPFGADQLYGFGTIVIRARDCGCEGVLSALVHGGLLLAIVKKTVFAPLRVGQKGSLRYV